MTANLAVRLPVAAPDPARGRPAAPDAGSQAGRRAGVETTSMAMGGQPAAAAAGDGREALRLRALLTDPAVRVSTHRDDASGHLVMQVENRATGETVEQIPSETLLRLYTSIRERLIDQQA